MFDKINNNENIIDIMDTNELIYKNFVLQISTNV